MVSKTPRTSLVTGGSGFLGSHLCERLLASGRRVICVDNFLTGDPENIEHLRDHPGFTVLEHDILQPLDVGVDQIYNLACPASPVHYQRHPIDTVKASTLGVMNLLELARRTGARFFQTSTSEIYGDPQVHPQTEDYVGHVNTLGPRACYDEGKRVAETLCMDFHRKGVEVRIVRVFNTYGPRMAVDDGRVVSNFVVAALRGESLELHGDGSQTRSFCYVDDLIGGFIALMDQGSDTGPVNLGNPQEVTMKELAERVIELTGSSSRLIVRNSRSDDPSRRKPDVTRAERLLGWKPVVSLAEGLTKTIEYFRQRLADSTTSPPESSSIEDSPSDERAAAPALRSLRPSPMRRPASAGQTRRRP